MKMKEIGLRKGAGPKFYYVDPPLRYSDVLTLSSCRAAS